MPVILMSIKPEFAEKILSGEKRVEFRRALPARPFRRVVIYASALVKKIVGEFSVSGIGVGNPKTI